MNFIFGGVVLRLIAMVGLGAILAGCGQGAMVRAAGEVRDQLMEGRYDAALATLRASKEKGFKEQDRVVYWMHEGMLLHLTGRYKESSAVLEKAEHQAKELYTKSVSKQIKAIVTSDAAKDYAGEDYENVLVNVVKALNYLYLGDQEGALVEARKINEKLLLYNTRYEQKNVYNQDAFAHWLMGLLFELERSYDDARIAYVKALDSYRKDYATNYGTKPPAYVAEDAVRAALLSKDSETVAALRKDHGAELGASLEALKEQGEVLLILMNGEGPSKTDLEITCYFYKPEDWTCDAEPGEAYIKRIKISIPKDATVIKMAIPELVLSKPRYASMELVVGGKISRTVVAEPVNEIASKTLRDKMQRVWRDTVIRAVTKGAASQAAGGAGAALGGTGLAGMFRKGTSALMQATEEADKRAWTSLPARLEVARILVPPGEYTPAVRHPGGLVVPLPPVKVHKGRRTIIRYKVMP